MSRIENGVEIFSESNGLIESGKFVAGKVTTAGRFLPGASILGVDGIEYKNGGSTASPSWQNSDEIASSEIAAQAITMPKLVRGTNGQIIVANTAADSAYVTMSGDATLSAAGALTIGSGKIGITELESSMDFTGGVLAKISVPSGTPVNAVAAVGTITVSGTPVADETMVIGAVTYTFKAARALAGEITIDADNAVQVTNIVAATDLDSTDVVCTDGAGNTVVVTSVLKGTAGNAYIFTENATGIAVNGAGTLGTTVLGVAGTVGAAREMYADASYLYYTNAANSASGNGWRRIALGSAY